MRVHPLGGPQIRFRRGFVVDMYGTDPRDVAGGFIPDVGSTRIIVVVIFVVVVVVVVVSGGGGGVVGGGVVGGGVFVNITGVT